VLDGVNLSVERGEFIAVVGPSGSGKTTLISLVAGLLHPDRGQVLLEGEPVGEPGPDRGLVFQNYSLLPWLSVRRNGQLAGDAVAPHLSPDDRRARADHFVKMVRLEAAAEKLPRELSGGMRQRVAVARGLAMDPRILLMDEPFSALDALTRASLQDELARIWEEDRKTVLLITNDVDEAVLLADRIYPMTAGPGARLGDPIPVDLPRPRTRRRLSLAPGYQRVRRDLVDFLTRHRTISPTAPKAHAPTVA
jgi:nitrate/nitrite transport system ATP-binding protein